MSTPTVTKFRVHGVATNSPQAIISFCLPRAANDTIEKIAKETKVKKAEVVRQMVKFAIACM